MRDDGGDGGGWRGAGGARGRGEWGVRRYRGQRKGGRLARWLILVVGGVSNENLEGMKEALQSLRLPWKKKVR